MSAVCQHHHLTPDAFWDMTFPQMRALGEDPEQIQRDWKWSRMTEEAREKVRRLKRDGFKDF